MHRSASPAVSQYLCIVRKSDNFDFDGIGIAGLNRYLTF